MIERLVQFALQQRVFVLLATVGLLVFGAYALSNLPVEAFPDVQDVQVQIVTQYRGRAPEEVERMISKPIEVEMSGVPHVTQLRSVSITGLSVVTLIFADHTDDYFARQQVLEKLQNVNLPTGIQPQLAPLTTAVGEIFRYTVKGPEGMPLTDLRTVQDWIIRPALRRVGGVADIVSFGGAIREIQVKAHPGRLERHGVSLQQLSDALANNSANGGGGLLQRGDEALVIRSVGLFSSLDDIRRSVVVSRDGHPVTVGDLAEVSYGERERSGVVAFDRNDDVVEGIVDMTKGQDPDKVIGALRAAVAQLAPQLPPGVRIEPFYDRTDLIRHTVHTVGENMVVGAALVVGILMIFLRSWSAALIVASVIPLSLLFAFSLMHIRGVSANLISLGAVDFGIIIDSAVVLVEALMVRLARDRHDAATRMGLGHRMHVLKQTTVSMGHPIIFSKAIIVLAFLPIFTFQRVEGKIFTPMAFTLSFALVGAVLLTMTLVPALLTFQMTGDRLREKHLAWMDRLQSAYRAGLLWAQGRRWLVVGGAGAILAATLALAPLLGSEFLPKLDEGNLWVTLSLPPASSLNASQSIEHEVRAVLLSTPEVVRVVSHVGRPDDGTDPKGPNNIEILADLKPREAWRFDAKDELVDEISRKLERIPGVHANFSQVIEDNVEEALSGAKGEIAVKIFGPDLDVLSQKADQVADILRGIRGSADVAAVRIGGQAEVTIEPDRDRLARYGISINDFNTLVQTALGGATLNTFFEEIRNVDVTLRFEAQARDAIDDIGRLPVALPGGGSVLLADVARFEVKQGATRIAREAGGRMVHVKANLRGRDQGSFVAEARERVEREVKLPSGYRMTWGGQFENQQRAIKRLAVIVPLSLAGIFVLLFWAFRSVRRATLVLLMVPFTLTGGFAALALAGMHLSISAAVGFIAVAGISVQNGVILVEEVIAAQERGGRFADAVIEGAVMRLRPILMTALMAGIGLLPAALSHGIGSETQRPFALVIVGGIVSATVFTLALLPVLMPLFEKSEDV
ncbi:MAG: efflux RND transporter permease subunit [Proteobacteria bacterium]|nr:efflux RND transporter permease subunit [Pseudomonadota bacterium]